MSAATRTAWEADMQRLDPQLQPHVVTIDGERFLSDECPPHLAELHGKLAQIGYANGWLS